MDTNQKIWNNIYEQGNMLNRYPYDAVVSFLFRHGKKGQKVLELGCGAGANLWFAAREGFEVIGTDFSKAPLEYARARFEQENLQGEFIHCAFPEVPVVENSIDLAIDRGALICVTQDILSDTLRNLYKSLKPNSLFLSQTYTTKHSSYKNPSEGKLTGVGQLYFLSKKEIEEIYGRYFKILDIEERIYTQVHPETGLIHSEWVIICQKS